MEGLGVKVVVSKEGEKRRYGIEFTKGEDVKILGGSSTIDVKTNRFGMLNITEILQCAISPQGYMVDWGTIDTNSPLKLYRNLLESIEHENYTIKWIGFSVGDKYNINITIVKSNGEEETYSEQISDGLMIYDRMMKTIAVGEDKADLFDKIIQSVYV